MSDCIDQFKVGCTVCGQIACCCNNRKVLVHDTRGDCVPLTHDPAHIFSTHRCDVKGGAMTVKAPQFELIIENPPDDILRDSNGSPVLKNGVVVAKSTLVSHC
jgi:hypothetical protein